MGKMPMIDCPRVTRNKKLGNERKPVLRTQRTTRVDNNIVEGIWEDEFNGIISTHSVVLSALPMLERLLSGLTMNRLLLGTRP